MEAVTMASFPSLLALLPIPFAAYLPFAGSQSLRSSKAYIYLSNNTLHTVQHRKISNQNLKTRKQPSLTRFLSQSIPELYVPARSSLAKKRKDSKRLSSLLQWTVMSAAAAADIMDWDWSDPVLCVYQSS